MDGYIRNCFIQFREDDPGPMFDFANNRVRLDGYAIVPIEVYERYEAMAKVVAASVVSAAARIPE